MIQSDLISPHFFFSLEEEGFAHWVLPVNKESFSIKLT